MRFEIDELLRRENSFKLNQIFFSSIKKVLFLSAEEKKERVKYKNFVLEQKKIQV